jgi:hypothetical protein
MYSEDMLDIIGLFLFIAGFVVGLGATLVVDIHGFLGMRSPYWSETTIRVHKVTKPLIWVGILLAGIGGYLTYRTLPLAGISLAHACIALVLVLNGLWLSFWLSPRLLAREREGNARVCLPVRMQVPIACSLTLSAVLWWTALLLLVLYIQ